MRLNKEQLKRMGIEVNITPIDPSSYGARNFRVDLSKKIERRVFEDAMFMEFGYQLENKPSQKLNSFMLSFSWRKMPNDVWGRIIDRLYKIGHLEVKK